MTHTLPPAAVPIDRLIARTDLRPRRSPIGRGRPPALGDLYGHAILVGALLWLGAWAPAAVWLGTVAVVGPVVDAAARDRRRARRVANGFATPDAPALGAT